VSDNQPAQGLRTPNVTIRKYDTLWIFHWDCGLWRLTSEEVTLLLLLPDIVEGAELVEDIGLVEELLLEAEAVELVERLLLEAEVVELVKETLLIAEVPELVDVTSLGTPVDELIAVTLTAAVPLELVEVDRPVPLTLVAPELLVLMVPVTRPVMFEAL